MRVLVCGGRDFADAALMADTLRQYDIELLIHGAARGADSLAAAWAHDCHVPQLGVRADWNKHGRAAGPIRNQIMLDEGKPHLVIAFPGGTGTADMVRRARAAKVRVISVPQKGIEQS